MNQKDVHMVSNEELVTMIEQGSGDDLGETTDVPEFIRSMRFRVGRKRVSFEVIHLMYRQWSVKPTRKTTLGRELQKRFKKVRSRYRVYYLLNRNGS